MLRFRHKDFVVERPLTRAEFEELDRAPTSRVSRPRSIRCWTRPGLPAERMDRVFLTGGTAFVPAVRRLFEDRFGGEKLAGGGEFVSVAEGLALIGQPA